MEKTERLTGQNEGQEARIRKAGRWKMLLIMAVCASPLIFSYLTYYVIKPQARNNYGTILDPRNHPIPMMNSVNLEGTPLTLNDLKGKWIMFQVGGGNCAQDCRQRLLDMRQLRIAQGKERDRIERAWLVTDLHPVEPALLNEYEGTRVLRVPADTIARWLPAEEGGKASDHIYVIDPLGNLMMRFPKDADPNKIKKDLAKLLKASSIG